MHPGVLTLWCASGDQVERWGKDITSSQDFLLLHEELPWFLSKSLSPFSN